MVSDESRQPTGAAPPPGSSDDQAFDASAPADFSTLVISLSTSALLHLGEIPNPDGGKPRFEPAMARHTIDMLSMLKEKTSGNLTEQESGLLSQFLYDLRMKFLAKTKAQ